MPKGTLLLILGILLTFVIGSAHAGFIDLPNTDMQDVVFPTLYDNKCTTPTDCEAKFLLCLDNPSNVDLTFNTPAVKRWGYFLNESIEHTLQGSCLTTETQTSTYEEYSNITHQMENKTNSQDVCTLYNTTTYSVIEPVWHEGLPSDAGCFTMNIYGLKNAEENVDWIPQVKINGLFINTIVTQPDWAWWLATCAKKKAITINIAQNYDDFEMAYNVTYDSDMKYANFSDIFFVNKFENETYPLVRNQQVAGSYVSTDFKGDFTTANGTQAYLYYDCTVNSTNDYVGVYHYYNDFDSHSTGSTYGTYNSVVSNASGYMLFDAGTGNSFLMFNNSQNMTDMNISAAINLNGTWSNWIGIGYTPTSPVSGINAFSMSYLDGRTTLKYAVGTAGGGTDGSTADFGIYSTSTWYQYTINYTGGKCSTIFDNNIVAQAAGVPSYGYIELYSDAADFIIDNVTQRAYINPMPTYSTGTEESNSFTTFSGSNPTSLSNLTTNTIPFNFTVLSSFATMNCSLYLNHTGSTALYNQSVATTNNTLTNFTAGHLAYGNTYYYFVKCENGSDFNTTADIYFNVVDNTAPVTTASFVAWTVNSEKITLSCSDAGIGCNQTDYCIDVGNLCIPNLNYTGPFFYNTSGTYYIRYNSTDYLNNKETVKSDLFTVGSTSTFGAASVGDAYVSITYPKVVNVNDEALIDVYIYAPAEYNSFNWTYVGKGFVKQESFEINGHIITHSGLISVSGTSTGSSGGGFGAMSIGGGIATLSYMLSDSSSTGFSAQAQKEEGIIEEIEERQEEVGGCEPTCGGHESEPSTPIVVTPPSTEHIYNGNHYQFAVSYDTAGQYPFYVFVKGTGTLNNTLLMHSNGGKINVGSEPIASSTATGTSEATGSLVEGLPDYIIYIVLGLMGIIAVWGFVSNLRGK